MLAVTAPTPSRTATNAASATQRRRHRTPASVVIESACAMAGHQCRDRLEQDLEVEPGAPVLDVEVVPLDAVFERGLAAQSVDLRPAGEARLHAVAIRVAVDRLLEE